MSPRKLTSIAALAAVLLALAPSATAHHEGLLCDYLPNRGLAGGAIQWPLPFRWMNWTYWDSERDYIALRKDGAGNVTYRQWVPGGPPSSRTTTTHGYDEFRTSGIQRAGYTFTNYSIRQWSHDGCASR